MATLSIAPHQRGSAYTSDAGLVRNPRNFADYDSKAQAELIDFYLQVFGRALLCDLGNKRSEVTTWIDKLPEGWGHRAAGLIAAYALECGTALRMKHGLREGSLSEFNSLDRLQFGKDRDIWGFRISLRKAIIEIFRNTFALLHNIVGTTINSELLTELAHCEFLEADAVTELMNDLAPKTMDADDVRAWISKEAQKWDSIIEQFPNRAGRICLWPI